MQTIVDKAVIQEHLDRSGCRDIFPSGVIPYLNLTRFSAGEPVMHQGDQTRTLYYLTDGQIKIFRTNTNGTTSLIELAQAPYFIGELELLGVLEETLGVSAQTDCLCIALPVEQCQKLLLNDVAFLNRLCSFLGAKSQKHAIRAIEASAFPLKNRLANFILLKAKDDVYSEKLTVTAESLSVTYRHLQYVLATLCKDQLVERCSSGYRILNLPKLQQLAQVLL